MRARLTGLRDDWDVARKTEREARGAYEDAAKALGEAILAANGWKEGDEIALTDGGKVWISHIHFRTYERQLVAACYRTLKTGKRSVRPDLTVTLWKEPSK
jgi:hypothetical protein